MNKKLTTLAVAAAIAAPMTAMADATMYGKLHVSIDYYDVDDPTTFPNGYERSVGTDFNGDPVVGIQLDEFGRRVFARNPDGTIDVDKGRDFNGWSLNRGLMGEGVARSNRVGIKGSEDIGSGLKAIYQVEFGVTLANRDSHIANGDKSSSFNMRNSFLGVAGNFGTALVGRHDTPLKISTGRLDLFADTMADYNGTIGFEDVRADSAIAYISPSWGGFQLAAALVSPGGATVNAGENYNADGIADGWSIAAMYKNGPWYASAAYERFDSDMLMDSDTADAGSAACDPLAVGTCDYIGDDYNKWRIGLGILDWNGFYLTAIYEDQDNIAEGQAWEQDFVVDVNGNAFLSRISGTQSQKMWQVQAGYAFGNNMVKAMYGQVDRNSGDFAAANYNSVSDLKDAFESDRSAWAVAFDHNFSKRTRVYAVYTNVDEDELTDWSGFSLGMIHKF